MNNNTDNSIIINISLITLPADTGGSQIISYELKRADSNAGLGSVYVTLYGLNVFSLSTSYTDKNNNLGSTYKYIYRAKNANGWGSYSGPTYIKAITKPNTPDKIIFVSATNTRINIEITPLVDFNGSAYVTYELYIDQGAINSVFTKITTYNGTDLNVTLQLLI